MRKMPRGQSVCAKTASQLRRNMLELAIDVVGYWLPKDNRTALNDRGVDRKKGWQGALSS
jgi:hypothetical protein